MGRKEGYLDFVRRFILRDSVDPQLPVVDRHDDSYELLRLDLVVVERSHGALSVRRVGVPDEHVAPVRLREIHHQAKLIDLTDLLENGNLKREKERYQIEVYKLFQGSSRQLVIFYTSDTRQKQSLIEIIYLSLHHSHLVGMRRFVFGYGNGRERHLQKIVNWIRSLFHSWEKHR